MKNSSFFTILILMITSCGLDKNAILKSIPPAKCNSVKAICIEQDGEFVRALEVSIAGPLYWYDGWNLVYSIEQASTFLFSMSQVDNGVNPQIIIDPSLNSLVNGQTYDLWISDPNRCSFVADFKDCPRPPSPIPNTFCCPTTNLISNGDFESGNTGFSSNYFFNNATPPLLPKKYDVIPTSFVNQYCSNWKVDDHSTNCDQQGKFMVVNGLTSQSPNSSDVIWQQTINNIEVDSQYRFCVNLRHIEKCCFDNKPVVKITISPGGITNWVTINTNPSDPCDWQLEDLNFTASSNSINIKIELNETAFGDGNDLAIDDIALHKTPKSSFGLYADLQTTSGNFVANASINTSGTSDDVLPDPTCKYAWVLAEITSYPPITIGAPIWIENNGATYGWGLTTNFNGYPFQAGTVNDPKIYLAYLYVYDCDCNGSSYAYKIIGGGTLLKKKPIVLNTQQEAVLRKNIESKILKKNKEKE